MKKRTAILWLMAFAVACSAGCGAPSTPPPTPANAGNAATTPGTTPPGAPGGVGVEFQGVDLRLFSMDPTQTGPRKPRFWLHAEKQTISAEGATSFEKAHAVVYGKDTDVEQMVIDAGAGQYKQEEMVYLGNGVVARAGDTTIQLTDMTYENNEKVARSDNPVSIDSPRMQLKADNVRLNPDTRSMVLESVSGTVQLGELMK